MLRFFIPGHVTSRSKGKHSNITAETVSGEWLLYDGVRVSDSLRVCLPVDTTPWTTTHRLQARSGYSTTTRHLQPRNGRILKFVLILFGIVLLFMSNALPV